MIIVKIMLVSHIKSGLVSWSSGNAFVSKTGDSQISADQIEHSVATVSNTVSNRSNGSNSNLYVKSKKLVCFAELELKKNFFF